MLRVTNKKIRVLSPRQKTSPSKVLGQVQVNSAIPVGSKITVLQHYRSFNKLQPLRSKQQTPKSDKQTTDDLMHHLTEARVQRSKQLFLRTLGMAIKPAEAVRVSHPILI